MKLFIIPVVLFGLWSCVFPLSRDQQAQSGLKDLFYDDFYIGAALSGNDVREQPTSMVMTLSNHFNSLSPENLMKWQSIHPDSGKFQFVQADRYVELGKRLGCHLVGHTLVWHKQTPEWVFKDQGGMPRSSKDLSAMMQDHIQNVMGHFKGSVKTWDVVNEAFTDEGDFRPSAWYQTLGEDFIKLAFQTANEADPEAELYYNDYNVWKPKKTDAILSYTSKIRNQGVNIHGIGMQCHLGLEYPTVNQLEVAIQKIIKHGFRISITELDIDVLPNQSGRQGADIDANFPYEAKYDPYKDGLPPMMQEKLTQRYREIFKLFLKYSKHIDRVTFWSIRDQDSWLNNWPIRGRTAYPLLFDEEYQLKDYIFDSLTTLKKGDNSG